MKKFPYVALIWAIIFLVAMIMPLQEIAKGTADIGSCALIALDVFIVSFYSSEVSRWFFKRIEK